MSSMWLTTGGTIPAYFRGIQIADHRMLAAMPVCSEELHLGSPKEKKPTIYSFLCPWLVV